MRAQLGDIQFTGLYGFGSLSEREETRFTRHDLAENKPVLQKVGWELDEKSVGIRLHSMFSDPEERLEELRAARIAGEAMPLVWGNGDYKGDFVIESMEVHTRRTDRDGNLVSVDLQIELIEYFDPDADRSEQVLAIRQALATDAANPIIYDRDGTLSEAAQAQRYYVEALAQARQIQLDAEQAARDASRRKRAFERIIDRVRDFENTMERMRTLILRGMERYHQAEFMVERIEQAVEQAGQVGQVSVLESVTATLEASGRLREAMQALSRATDPFVGQGAARQV